MPSKSANCPNGCSGKTRTFGSAAAAASRLGFITPSPQMTKTMSLRAARSAAASGITIKPCLPPNVPENSTTIASVGMPSFSR